MLKVDLRDTHLKENLNSIKILRASDLFSEDELQELYDSQLLKDSQKAESEEKETANWIVWAGWSGNHDQRIERATCSSCGYIHKTVYRSLDNLSPTCPNCNKKMISVNLQG